MVPVRLTTVLCGWSRLLLFLLLPGGHLRLAWCENAGFTEKSDTPRTHVTEAQHLSSSSTIASALMVDSITNDTLTGGIHITETVCQDTATMSPLFHTTNITAPAQVESDPSAASQIEESDLIFVMDVIVKPIISIPGCMFNVLSMYVLAKQPKVTSTNRLLIGLSIADLSYLLVSLVSSAYRILEKFNYLMYIRFLTGARYEWNGYFMILVTGRSSNAFIVVLSLERFMAVKFPLIVKSSWLSRHPSKILAGVFAFVTVLLLPNLFRLEYVESFDPVYNHSFVSIKPTHFAQTNPVFYTVYTYVLLALLRFLPLISVVFLNIAIIVTLKFSQKSWNSSQIVDDKRRSKELKVTRMLVTIAFLFVVCVSPGFVHSLLANFLPGYNLWGHNSRLWHIVLNIYPVFDVINSSVNFIVYMIMSENFRSAFLEVLCRKATPLASQQSTSVLHSLSELPK